MKGYPHLGFQFLNQNFFRMKALKNLDKFQDLSKDHLIDEMLKGTIKGGCCILTYDGDGNLVDAIREGEIRQL